MSQSGGVEENHGQRLLMLYDHAVGEIYQYVRARCGSDGEDAGAECAYAEPRTQRP